MFQKAVSGQYLFFPMISVLSGYPVTGFSGAISGRKLMDGSAMSLLSGNIIEVSGGMYRANLYDYDTSGNNIGYFFTASGCLPISFSVVTQGAWSGNVFLNSGATVSISSGQLSGQIINLLSGYSFPASGISVLVYSGQMSGQPETLLSGYSYIASGISVTATVSVSSGSLYLASGSIFLNTFSSGLIGGGSGNLPSSWGSSGAVSVGQNLDKIGYSLLSGVLSGQQVSLVSGQSYTASGIFATAAVTVTSGSIYLASGSIFGATFASGVIGGGSGNLPSAWGNSGAVVVGQNLDKTAYSLSSGALSGQQVTLTSGQSYTASGIFTTASVSVASGSLYLASGSIFLNTFASGVVGGGSGTIPSAWGNSGAISVGQNLDKAGYTLLSGQSYTASGISTVSTIGSGVLSGQLVTLVSGQSYTASGIFSTSTVASGSLSGQQVTLVSGFSYTASGISVTATANVFSGSLYLASGSIFGTTFASGVIGGGSGNLPSSWGNSGSVVTALNQDKTAYTLQSGLGYLASGSININTFVPAMIGVSGGLPLQGGVIPSATPTLSGGLVTVGPNSGQISAMSSGLVGIGVGKNFDKSGYTLSASGLDTIQVESGMNFRQSQSAIAASTAGRLSGAGTTTVLIDAANASGTNRITATVDASGNRVTVALNLPS